MGLRAALARVPAWAWWIAAITAIRVPLAAAVPLTPEEAYHWNFAVHPDWSYYDHPAMIAWSIAVGRLLFGDVPFGVRFVPLLFSIGTMGVLARLAGRMWGSRAAFWAVLLLSIEPVTLLASGAGFPDSPELFFWALALAWTWRALETGRGTRWLAAGAALGASMLSKYTAVFLPLSILLYLVFSKRDRRWLATPWPYLAGVLALLVFAPVFYWNWMHDWASFRFQSVERFREAESANPLGGIRFLGQQWLGILPLTLPLAAIAVVRTVRSGVPAERFLLWTFAPMFAFFFALGWTRSIHLMWPLPSHLGLAVLMAGVVAGAQGRIARFYGRNRAWLVGVSGAALAAGGLHLVFFLPWISPVPGLYGWAEVAARAREIRAGLPEDAFYVGLGRKYTCTSQLAFHLRAPRDVQGKNVLGAGALQYDYWCRPQDLAGRDAVVVLEGGKSAGGTLEDLRRHFRSVEQVEPGGEVDVPVGRSTLLPVRPVRFLLFRAFGYKPKH